MRPLAVVLAVATLAAAQQTGLLYNAGVAQCVALDASFQPCTSAPLWAWANNTAFRAATGVYLTAPPATCTFGVFGSSSFSSANDVVYATGAALRTASCPAYCLQAGANIAFGACTPSLASQQWAFPYAVPPPPSPPSPPAVVLAVGAPLVQLTYPAVGAWPNAGWLGGAVAVAAVGARTEFGTPAAGPLQLPPLTLEGALTISMRVHAWAPGELWTFTAAAAPIMVATATPAGLVVTYGPPPVPGATITSQTATTCGLAWGAQPAHLAVVITGAQPSAFLNGGALACTTAATSGATFIYPAGGFKPSTRYRNATLLRTSGAAVSEFRIDLGVLSAATIAALAGRTAVAGMPPYVPVPQLPAAAALPVAGLAASSVDAAESPLSPNMTLSGGQFFSTLFEVSPWVRADLGGLAAVTGVAAAWRADGCLSCTPITNLTIYAGASTDYRSNAVCGTVAPTGVTATPCNTTAQYITVVGVSTVVQLRALRVFGTAIPPQPVLPPVFTLADATGQCAATGCALMTLTDGVFIELATGATHGWIPVTAAGGGIQLLSGPPGGPFYATAVAPAGAASALGIPQPQALSAWYSAATWGAGAWRDAITNASVVAPLATNVVRSVSVAELSSPISYIAGGAFALPTALPQNFTMCTVSRQVILLPTYMTHTHI